MKTNRLTFLLVQLYLWHFKGYHTVTDEILRMDIQYVLETGELPDKCCSGNAELTKKRLRAIAN